MRRYIRKIADKISITVAYHILQCKNNLLYFESSFSLTAESTVCLTHAFLRLCCRPHWYKLCAPKISEMTMPLIAIKSAKNSSGDDILFESVFLNRSIIVNPNIWPTTE